MAERQLSASEISSLLSVFRGGSASALSDVEPLDLSQPTRIPRAAREALRIRHEQAARLIRRDLRMGLGVELDLTLEDFDQEVFSDWRTRLPDPCIAYTVETAPLKDPALVVVDHAFAYAAIDRMLGGTGDVGSLDRDPTATESAVLKEILDPVLSAHAFAWQPFVPLRPRIQKLVTNPRFLREIAEGEVVLSATYRFEGFGDGALIRYAVPASGLEPHLQHMPRDKGNRPPRADLRNDIAASLAQVAVGLSVGIGRTSLAVRDVMSLERGDVLVLDKSINAPLDLVVESAAKFKGHLQRKGQGLVFRIVSAGEEQPGDSGEDESA